MEPDHFADASANAIANYRAAETTLNAKTESALRQVVGFRENGEMGIGTALPIAVNRVEIRLAHQLACYHGLYTARKLESRSIRA